MSAFTLRQQIGLTLLLFTLLLFLVPQGGYGGDLNYWYRWAAYSFEHGLGNVYQLQDNNYNPLYHYILWLYGQMMGSSEKIYQNLHWLKAYTLVFDFAGAFWAASLVPERHRRFGLALLLLFNIGYLYNTLIWIQVDSIFTFFAFGAVALAVRRHAVGSLLCYILALAAKTQAIIFLPPLLLLWSPLWWQRPWRLVWSGVAGAVLTTLVLAPFIWWSWESYLPRIIEINSRAAEVYPRVSMYAYNFWFLALYDAWPPDISDLLPFLGGATYRTWGLWLFFGFSALALWPLLWGTVQQLRRAKLVNPAPDMALVLLSCGSIPLIFSYFNTQMHERYWHASLLFLAAYGFQRRDYLPYVLVSVAYFLNLESILHSLQLHNYGVLVFNDRFIAALFTLTLLLVLVKIYRLAPWRARAAAPVPPAATLMASVTS